MAPQNHPDEAYQARLLKVVAYIDANLGEHLTLDVLAGVAAFSKYHFHRQFSAIFGLGIFEVVNLARLKRASYELTFRHRSVLDVALDAGFEGPESFARSFKKHFGQTPSEWRDQPDWLAWHDLMKPLHHFRRNHMSTTLTTDAVRIIDFPKTRIAVLSHRGDPHRLGESIRTFIAWRRENHLSPQVSATFNLLYNDPDNTPPDEFRMDICAAVNGTLPANDLGIVERIIPAGRCATFRLVGSDQGLGLALERLYRDWLPGSGEELRNFPPFVQRVTLYPEVPESELITDIFLPLKF